jgi:hypothetical protein
LSGWDPFLQFSDLLGFKTDLKILVALQ